MARAVAYSRRMDKVKVALFLDAQVARELKSQAALCGARGLSDYITRLITPPKKRIKKNGPVVSGAAKEER